MNSLRLLKKFNQLVEKSMADAHAVSFAYHLLMSDKSTTKLISVLRDEEGLKKEVTCLHQLDQFLQVSYTIHDMICRCYDVLLTGSWYV